MFKKLLFTLFISIIAKSDNCGFTHSNIMDKLNLIKGGLEAKRKQTRILFDLAQTKTWSAEAKLPCPNIFEATYKKNGKTLSFVAVNHIVGPADINQDHQLIMIKKRIGESKPDTVLIESVTNGVMPPEGLQSISDKCQRDSIFLCGESAYAALNGGLVGAAVIGGEPIPSDLDRGLSSALSNQEIKYYKGVQILLTLKAKGIPAEQWSNEFSREALREFGPSDKQISYSELKSFLNKNLNVPPEDVRPDWLEPRSDLHAGVLNRIAFNVDRIREPMIVKTVERSFNEGAQNLIIVYGAGHFYKQEAIYRKHFGEPKIRCL
jgi:hypothetical protein